MSEEDIKLQKHLIDEMMKVSKTNPDVMIYMGILMKNYEKLEEEIERLKQGYCELKEKCNKGECDCTHEEYNGMCEENIKMDLEIERLKEEYMILQNASDEVEEEKDKEIERLNGIIEIKTNRIQDLMSRLSKRTKEIERLNNDIKVLLKENENKEKVIKAQDNIIKEVREYIEKASDNEYSYGDYEIHYEVKKELLDILKGVDKE